MSLLWPDAASYAEPTKPNTPEFDQWAQDDEVKIACNDLRVDRKTGKYFAK